VKKKAVPGADYTRDEAAALAAAVVASQIQRERLVADRDAAKEAAAVPFREPIDKADAEIADGLARLEAWAAAHKAEFGDARSLVLPGGNRVGWRLGNWSAKTIKGWTWDKVRDALAAMSKGWREQFLRVKVEVNKEAIVAARNVAQWEEIGVRFEQAETFYLEPHREEGGRIA
jgi:phage host-nuclease inhibitor protein Gam